MAAIAEFLLLFGEKELRRCRGVNRVTARTDHVDLGMLRTPDTPARHVFGMTAEAGVESFFRPKIRECADTDFTSAGSHMVAARAMAPFAAGFFSRLFAGRNRLIVWILVEVHGKSRMAALADFIANVMISGFGRSLGASLEGRQQRQRESPDPIPRCVRAPRCVRPHCQ